MLPIKPPVELNEEQREAAEEAGLLDFLQGKEQTELTRVAVPRHLRVVGGKVQDVEAYHYEREPGLGAVLLDPPKEVRAASRPPTDEEFEEKYGHPRPKDGEGDCYVAAATVLIEAAEDGEDMSTYRYCIGQPLGQGPLEGVRFDHAWVEKNMNVDIPPEAREAWQAQGIEDAVIKAVARLTTVIDRANGSDYEGLSELYYLAGDIQPEEVVRYTWEEFQQLAEMNEWI
jgi:hypothetical protein